MKPEHIPDDIWEAAQAVARTIPDLDAEIKIAPALLAERLKERERFTAAELPHEVLQAGEDAFVLRFAYVPANPWDAVETIYRAMVEAIRSRP